MYKVSQRSPRRNLLPSSFRRAEKKLQDAAAIGENKNDVAKALLEVAFFYQESERADTACIALDLAASLMGKNTGASLERMFGLPELKV
ncbi:MAG: hypothetical protein IPJ40_12160 [Saprospirales bacterium]|nr:hypothetical protein [Saprospirales bacterium]